MPETAALRMGLLMVRAMTEVLLASLDGPEQGCEHQFVSAGTMGSPNLRLCTVCGAQEEAKE